MRRTTTIAAAAASAALLASTLAPPANAAEGEVIADGLSMVLSVAVADDGTVYATQNFAGKIMRIAPGGEPEEIYAGQPGLEVGALSVSGDVVTFATYALGGPPSAAIHTLTHDAEDGWQATEVADTLEFETSVNPDRNRSYAISGLSKSCKKDIPKRLRPLVVGYKGIADSHPYATTTVDGTTYLADAAANAILAVDETGVSTLAVLPAAQVKVTKKLRKNMGLPKCTQGKVFKSEPVPTDVELGPDGNLYVTTLGGGLGESMPLGGLYQVTPAGKVTEQAKGLMSPVGLAISNTGTAYISQLFADTVLEVPFGGAPTTLSEIPKPGDVEFANGAVYVARTGFEDPEEGPLTGGVLRFE